MVVSRRLLRKKQIPFVACALPHRVFSHAVKVSKTTSDRITYNQVGIPMISREFQQILFDCETLEYDRAPTDVLKELQKHNIDIDRSQPSRIPIHFELPRLSGRNIAEHMESIANELTAPYLKLLESFTEKVPPMPSSWCNKPGWTLYKESGPVEVECPKEDILVFDTELLVLEGPYPVMATALSPTHWYSWVSPHLYLNHAPSTGSLDALIPLYGNQPLNTPKCVIGHFVSFDRARLLEEYFPQGTGTRFVDTMSMHVSISGLTSTQRHLKAAAKKHNFNNKPWKNYMQEHGGVLPAEDMEERLSSGDFNWISQTSLNNLTDVYRLYCKKEPPQDKSTRSVFEVGTKAQVRSQFQDLMRYCATDVLMTYEIFRKVLPLFKQRFPHPATLHGLLEMGSMYLPVNQAWLDFQKRSDEAFSENGQRQKRLLMQLADNVLERYSKPGADPRNDPWLWDLDWSKPKVTARTDAAQRLASLPKWYRELIPKPIKDNLDSGPALLTAQMRIAPKLLRLCWDGLPLHYDQELKWGVLIPGRAPQPYGDPRYYEHRLSTCDVPQTEVDPVAYPSVTVRSNIPVVKSSKALLTELTFPYKSYLSFWTVVMRHRLTLDFDSLDKPVSSSSSFAAAYCQRVMPSAQDDQLLEELRRSIEAMPLEYEERCRISSSIAALRQSGEKPSDLHRKSKQDSPHSVHACLGEMQVRGSAFWLDSKRFQLSQSSPMSSQRSKRARHAVDTVNPVIPTCWFCHLPHDSGDGLPVGSPLCRSFQVHIASNRLHSAPMLDDDGEHVSLDASSVDLADRLLLDRVHASFWQSYSKRVKEQMTVWFPRVVLTEEITTDESFNSSDVYGAILPQVIPAGTVSRRAVEPLWLTASNADKNRLGSEIKAMVQAFPGHCFVGADVDSQEMWIASLIGDASVGFHGATPYGWMTLEGNKADGTDLHTKIAQLVGISRQESKVLNYARLYGSGLEFAKHLLSKFSNLSSEQASLKATHLMRTTKGQRVTVDDADVQLGTNVKTKWQGGTESAVFNQLERIARSDDPRTPVLKAAMTRALNPKLVKDNFLPSRINWVVQSSAVDYLHCTLLVMSWLIKEYKLPARLCISIHDEVRYLCHKDSADRVALALQISNLFTRAFFAYQLGMRDLPESVAFFSSVEIDSCLRKNPEDDCVTPSNPDGIRRTYNINPGQSLTIEEILNRTAGGKLDIK